MPKLVSDLTIAQLAALPDETYFQVLRQGNFQQVSIGTLKSLSAAGAFVTFQKLASNLWARVA